MGSWTKDLWPHSRSRILGFPGGSSMQESRVGFLGEEYPLEEGMATLSSIPENCLENSVDRGAWQATVLAVGVV